MKLHKRFLLPKHITFSISHNEHKSSYRSLEDEVKDQPEYYAEDSISAEELAQAIALDEIWTAHWYPDTPVGFCVRHSLSLEGLLAKMETLCVGLDPS